MSSMPLALLVPGNHPPRPRDRPILDISTMGEAMLAEFCKPAGGVLVIDLETQGTESWDPSRKVAGVALADESGACYLHVGVEEAGQAVWRRFLRMLWEAKTPLLAHNVQFDAAWMSRDLTQELGYANYNDGIAWHNWFGCTLAMYKHLASEGFLGQRHGLAEAMVQMLGWEHTKGEEVAQWLVENGWTKKDIPAALLDKLTKE